MSIQNFDMEQFFIDRPTIKDLEKVIFSRKTSQEKFTHPETVYLEQLKDGKTLPSARELMAWYTTVRKRNTEILNTLKQKYPEYEDELRSVIIGFTNMNGVQKTLVTRTMRMLYIENGKGYLAFDEMEDDTLIRSDEEIGQHIYHMMSNPMVKKFLAGAEKKGRIIDEPEHKHESRSYSLNYTTPDYINSKIFNAIFGRGMEQEINAAFKPDDNWRVYLDLDADLFKYIGFMKGEPICYTTQLVMNTNGVSMDCGPRDLSYKTIENPSQFPSRK